MSRILSVVGNLDATRRHRLRAHLARDLIDNETAPVARRAQSVDVNNSFRIKNANGALSVDRGRILGTPPSHSRSTSTRAARTLLRTLTVLRRRILGSATLGSVRGTATGIPLSAITSRLGGSGPGGSLVSRSISTLGGNLTKIRTLTRPMGQITVLITGTVIIL